MIDFFSKPGKASFLLGGQWGSEGKGAAAAWLATKAPMLRPFDIATTNAGAQAGHTSTHDGVTKVVFHLPTYSLYRPCITYLNAGSVIDPEILLRELDENPQVLHNGLAIHPNAAIITPDCKTAEMRDDSAQTKIASTRKGVGEALSRKVLRSGFLAKDLVNPVHWYGPEIHKLQQFVHRIDLNAEMLTGKSVLVEVPQGHSLSVDGPFYPYTTSRNCTVGQAMSDAGIHPHFYHRSMLVIRTFPIKVGSLNEARNMHENGYSGGCFPDQHEITWDELGVAAEITTVTKRIRRVFTFSEQQVYEAIAQTRPNVVYVSFMDYLPNKELAKTVVAKVRELCNKYGRRNECTQVVTAWGPTTDDIIDGDKL